MKVRVGVIGPADSINLISKIAKEFDDQLIIVPLVYKHEKETYKITQNNQHLVDIWFFTGIIPYKLATNHQLNQQSFYPKLDGASLHKILLEMVYKENRKLEKISIDTLLENEVYETYTDLDINHEQLHIFGKAWDKHSDELVQFHFELYKSKKVDACITGLRSVYEKLTKMGIPSYWLKSTNENIRYALNTAIQQWETTYFKKSQLAVLLIKIGISSSVTENFSLAYEMNRLNLQLQEAVLDFTESITGSFISIGMGELIIFSTRGALQSNLGQMNVLMENILLLTDRPAHIGIGYGETTLSAEENARLALLHAQNYGDKSIFLVTDTGNIEGPLTEKESISYDFRTENKEVSEKLKKAGVAITTFNRIVSVQKNLGNLSITANDIALWLKMTERNARRILNSLVEQGLIEMIGKESPQTRGRPRQIYRIKHF